MNRKDPSGPVTPDLARTIANASQDLLDNHVEAIVRALEGAIEQVRRCADDRDYGRIAHELTYRLAHCDLGGLARTEAEFRFYDALARADDLRGPS